MASIFGATLGEVLVAVGVDTKQLETGLAKAKGEAESAGTGISQFGAYATAAFAVAGAAAVKFGIDAVQAAENHQKILAQLQVAIGGNTDALEEQARATSRATGFTEDQILSLDTVISRFDLSKTSMQKVTQATVDFARATGTDAASAAALLGKASLGNARALKQLGIQFTATGNAAADMATVVGLVEGKVGGAADAFGDTVAGKVAKLSAEFDALKVEAGTALLPALTAVVDELSTFATAIDDIANHHIPHFNLNLGLIGSALSLIHNPFSDVIKQVDDMTSGSDKASDAESKLAGATDGLTEADKKAADAAAAAAQALKDQKAATQALHDALPGLIGAVINLKNAQKDLHAAQQDSSTSAADLHQKELDVVQAFLSVKGAFGDIISDYKNGNATVEQVIGKFKDQAAAAGLTKRQIQDLIGVVTKYIGALKAIPDHVQTRVDLIGNTTGDFIPHGQGGGNGQGNGGGGNGGGGSSPQQGGGVHVHLHQPTFVGVPSAQVIDAIHAGLVRKGRRTGSLQLT